MALGAAATGGPHVMLAHFHPSPRVTFSRAIGRLPFDDYNGRMQYLIAFVLLCLLAGPVRAQGFEDGARAYKHEDYAAALGHWRPLAVEGHTAARFGLSILHSLGLGLPRDHLAGLTLFVESFKDERKPPPDHGEALRFWRRTAERGDPGAQYLLGLMHNWGRGVPQDYFAAVSWYHRAAEQGVAVAQTLLAAMHENGDGVPQNPIQAYKWYSIAAALGYKKAAASRAFIARQMTPEDILQAQRLSRAWLVKYRRK